MFEDFRLRVFVTVVESGSFTEASHLLHVSQPAISQNVAELEKMVGEPLFVRGRGSVTLTDKGRLFEQYARKILYWYAKADAVLVKKTEAPDTPTLLKIDSEHDAQISVIDGELRIRLV